MILICDIDETVSDSTHRSHLVNGVIKDWNAFLDPILVVKDPLIPNAQKGIEYFKKIADRIIFLTGRNESLRDCTTEWLKTHLNIRIGYHKLLMRPLGNLMKPTEYKSFQLINIKKAFQDKKWVCIDDDKYMMKVYNDFGAITLHAPKCWEYMFPEFKDLPEESNWRR